MTRVRNISLLKILLLEAVILGLFFYLGTSMALAQEATPAKLGDGASTIVRMLHWLIVTAFGQLVGWAGSIFDYTVVEFILEFGQKYNDTGLGGVIDNLWSTVRDIFNLTFIFGLVWIGFQMILGNNNANAQRQLGMLVLAALLVNFSLFITKLVVDFSNLAAVQIHSAFESIDGGSIGTTLVNTVKLTTALNSNTFNNWDGFAYVIGLLIFFVIAIFVFMAGAIMITIRFIALNLYLVFSPLMFLGWVFPNMAHYSKDYWQKFLSKAFFAPAFIFMIYLSFQVLNSYKLRGAADLGAALGGGGEGDVESIAFFLLAMGFMLASMTVANKMGANGATAAINMGHRLRRGAQGVMYRNTVGRSMKLPINMIDKLDSAAEKGGAKGLAARFARTTIGGESTRRALEKAKNYGAGGTGLAEAEKMNKERRQRATANNAIANSKAKIKAGQTTATELESLRSLTVPLTPDQKNRLDQLDKIEREMLSAVTNLSTSKLEEMSNEERKEIAHALTSNQVESLMKSDKLTEADKESIAVARQKAIKKVIGETGSIITKELTKLSIDQIETMGEEWIRDNAHLLSNGQMEDVKKSKKFSEYQKNNFSTKRKTEFSNIVRGGITADFESVMKDRKPAEVAQLGIELLSHDEGIKLINQDVLEAVIDKKTLSTTDRATLKSKIMALAGSGDAHAITLSGYFLTPRAINNW